MAGLNVACLLVGSSLSQGSSFHHFFFFLEFALSENTWMVMLKNLSITSAITVLQKVFPGVGFFPVWFAGRGLGWLWIKNIWIKFSRGVGGGSSPRCKKCVSILVPGWKEETLSPWIIPLHDFLIIIDTSALEPTSMPTKK